jgi:hypothetical protein
VASQKSDDTWMVVSTRLRVPALYDVLNRFVSVRPLRPERMVLVSCRRLKGVARSTTRLRTDGPFVFAPRGGE